MGQLSLDQLEARVHRMSEDPLPDIEDCSIDNADVKTECSEATCETQVKSQAENNIWEDRQQIKDAYHNKGQDGRSGNEEIPAENSALNLQIDSDKLRVENIQEQKLDEERNANSQCKKFTDEHKQIQESQDRDCEDSSLTFIHQKEKLAEHGSTSAKVAEETQNKKRVFKTLTRRNLNTEALVEDSILRHVLLLNEDGSSCKIRRKLDLDKTVKTELDMKPVVSGDLLNQHLLFDEQGSTGVACSQKPSVDADASSSFERTNHRQGNRTRANELFTLKRYLLTLGPNWGQQKINKGILGGSFTHSQKNQNQNNKKEDEMPALKSLKEEMHPGSCCREEQLHQVQDGKEDEMTPADDMNQCRNPEHHENDEMKEEENPHFPQGKTDHTKSEQIILPFCTLLAE